MNKLDSHFPLTNTQKIVSIQNAGSHGDSALKFIREGNESWARLHARAAYIEAYRATYGIPNYKMLNPDAYSGVTDETECECGYEEGRSESDRRYHEVHCQ